MVLEVLKECESEQPNKTKKESYRGRLVGERKQALDMGPLSGIPTSSLTHLGRNLILK